MMVDFLMDSALHWSVLFNWVPGTHREWGIRFLDVQFYVQGYTRLVLAVVHSWCAIAIGCNHHMSLKLTCPCIHMHWQQKGVVRLTYGGISQILFLLLHLLLLYPLLLLHGKNKSQRRKSRHLSLRLFSGVLLLQRYTRLDGLLDL